MKLDDSSRFGAFGEQGDKVRSPPGASAFQTDAGSWLASCFAFKQNSGVQENTSDRTQAETAPKKQITDLL